MRLLLQTLTAILFLAIMGIWLGGLRVVVVPSVSFAMSEGVALIGGGHGYRLVDSTTAMCLRTRTTDPECERAAIIEIAPQVLLALPYSRFLHDLTLSGLLPSADSFDNFALRD
ncbi:hypothetical protein QO002_001157 [Pararhizobium capsulatum DSM 1112]|uniref:Uncharacterized protein n=1 Tax=Pararhizobium capsulatum DSM 1112 TaxID=1121113 RepID=A0ABU0BL92_9HYPH|nr:hypothetical protein [Pararhizobium capsulatum DSM 1112]